MSELVHLLDPSLKSSSLIIVVCPAMHAACFVVFTAETPLAAGVS
jgi:hypothetical protein